MLRTLILLSLTLVVESINDLAWYSPVTRSVPIDLQPLAAKADLCSLPPDVGGCSKELIRYYYDATADECKRFIFSGCGGNSNRFMRRTHCRSRCVQKKANTDNFLKESKHRRTLTTTMTPSTVQTNPTTPTMAASTLAAVTRPVLKINKTKITPSIRECPHCDPIYGVCVDGDCGCIPGFKKLGRICIDINECASENICPSNSRCVNTIGSYRCDCDSGFTKNGECLVTKDACTDVFDINLTEEDCNNGEQLIRYYFDHDSLRCKQFFYGGCKSTSRNIFSDVQTCDELCASIPREELKFVSFGDLVEQKEIVNEIPMKLNLDIKSDTETTTVPIEIQQQEVEKIENIMKDITPNENVCLRDFDEVLRLECVSADWNEKFFWNYEKRECEPFWYDISCDLRDKAGKNFFESLETCQKTCHEETETVPVVEPSKKPIEFPPFHPSIENPPFEEHPLTKLSHVQKDTRTADELTVTTTNPIGSTSLPLEQKLEDVSEETFNLQHRLQYPLPSEESQSLVTDEIEEYESEEVTKPPIYRHPLEDIPIEEDIPLKPSRKLKKKVKLPISGNVIIMTTSTNFPEYFATESVTTQPIELATTEHLPETTPSIKIITLPTTVRLAPGPRMDPSSLVTKSAPLSKFDRQQYMLEFKKKLMALPDDSAASMNEPQFVLKPASSKPKRPLFTLPPSVFEEPTTTVPTPTPTVTHRHRLHHHRDSNDILSTQRDLPTTVEPDFVSKEKTKVETTLKELKLMNDLCEEPLHPRLEEDCSNENWVIRWYFSTDRGTCKSFWYGGCDSEARNFFPTVYSCKTACAHKYPVGEQKPNYVVPAVTDLITTESNPTSNLGAVVEIPKVSETKSMTADVKSLQENQREVETNTAEESAQDTKMAVDPCDDGYDEKWDEDCANDDWQVRSYYDQAKKGCKKFWWGGCLSGNRNLWKNQQDCEKHCGHKTDEEKSELEAPTEDIEMMPTMEVPSNAGTTEESVLARQAFQADLSRKLADIKRTEEGREDLAYSKAVDHPVTVASECLDPFDKTLEKSCSGGLKWKNRYYYDPDSQECKMFWNDGCFSTSRNNFEDIESCLWKCVGKHPEASGRGCLEKFDDVYLGDCRHGEFSTRFYFDHQTKKCSAFHWGGCQSSSLNFYLDSGECADTCERPPRELTQACVQPFDESYTDSCSADGRFQQFYYFDHSSHTCKMFWYGNCKGENQNIFPSLETCQWICERHVEERIPSHCATKFDVKYQESCGNGEWQEKWFFDQLTGECSSFWWDGCTSSSQNIFPDQQSCKRHCVHPGYAVESRLPDPQTKFRCLEPIEVGNCRETYPAFYYDKSSKVCRPFAYSGCDGNGNRFMTLSQCEGLCYEFNELEEPEMDCYQPLHIGYGKNDDHCLAQASYRFYFDREYGKCSQFWYLGCGGNANNFHSFEVCQRTCQIEKRRDVERKPRANSHVCSQQGASSGKCSSDFKRPVQRWSYHNKKCVSFTYSGCGGNDNRFATEWECNGVCEGIKTSNDPATCSHPPDWGRCNQLRYMWFYNETRGTCDQFLYGGCGGNTNRFESFEVCQKACEVSGLDPCLESLDRGNWCEAMSNRYYFNKRSKACRGFHYTGCGKSANNFMTLHECKSKCEARHSKSKREDRRNLLDWWKTDSSENYRQTRQKSSKKKQQTGYSGTKPVEKTPIQNYVVLQKSNTSYFKSEPLWYDYSLCLGFRYNISGRDTSLNVHLCSLDGHGDCYTQTLSATDGEEFCEVTRPFLRGIHLYSWYFGLDEKQKSYRDSNYKERRVQRPNETVAALLLLKPNHCQNIC